MTATATEIPTKAPAQSVTFLSISPNQVLTRRAERHVDNGIGGREVLTEREWMERMRDQGAPFDDTPWKVEFKNNMFSTSHEGLIAWLRGHRSFNSPGTGGFYEQGAAPEEPRPTLAEQATAIAEASVVADVDALTDVLNSERANHNRPVIIQAAEAALRKFAEGVPEPGADAGAENGDPPSTATS